MLLCYPNLGDQLTHWCVAEVKSLLTRICRFYADWESHNARECDTIINNHLERAEILKKPMMMLNPEGICTE